MTDLLNTDEALDVPRFVALRAARAQGVDVSVGVIHRTEHGSWELLVGGRSWSTFCWCCVSWADVVDGDGLCVTCQEGVDDA